MPGGHRAEGRLWAAHCRREGATSPLSAALCPESQTLLLLSVGLRQQLTAGWEEASPSPAPAPAQATLGPAQAQVPALELKAKTEHWLIPQLMGSLVPGTAQPLGLACFQVLQVQPLSPANRSPQKGS